MNRRQEINKIIYELEELKRKGGNSDFIYAIDANIDFYNSLKHIWSYIWWLIKIASKLEPNKLFEINDLLPEYDSRMHNKLLKMERNIPALVGLIVKRLSKCIFDKKKSLCILNFGSGSMEIERQVINLLIKAGNREQIIFVAVDQSSGAHQTARNNLRGHEEAIDIFSESNITKEKIYILKKNSNKKYIIIQVIGDALFPQDFLGDINFDIAFHALFRHHLSEKQQKDFDLIIKKRSKIILEYDGFRDLLGVIPQSIIGWFDPVFLNAEIFSNLRFIIKEEIYKRKKLLNGKLSLSKIGYYLLEY